MAIPVHRLGVEFSVPTDIIAKVAEICNERVGPFLPWIRQTEDAQLTPALLQTVTKTSVLWFMNLKDPGLLALGYRAPGGIPNHSDTN
jgi:hypothetical protein